MNTDKNLAALEEQISIMNSENTYFNKFLLSLIASMETVETTHQLSDN